MHLQTYQFIEKIKGFKATLTAGWQSALWLIPPMTEKGCKMSSADLSPTRPTVLTADHSRMLVTVYVATTVLSAFLLFLIQPIMARLTLPMLGGSPSVWALTMSFFQTALLLGYGYAHLVRKTLTPKQGIITHAALLAAVFLVLNFDVKAGSSLALGAGGENFKLLLILASTVGLPFAVMSANAPMLQNWFSRSGHKDADEPYFLYAASNFGSISALLLYPTVVEPLVGLKSQTMLWSSGFALLAAGVMVCGLLLASFGLQTQSAAKVEAVAATPWSTRVLWLVYAFLPSGLLSAWTNHITTDIAAAPFLWLPPLILYLVSFIVVFRPKMPVADRWMVLALLCTLPLAYAGNPDVGRGYFWSSMLGGVVSFFVAACLCHRRMYELRPSSNNLTEFYFVMSLGGVLGGAFVSLLAPVVFDSMLEYPLLLAVSLALVGRRYVAADMQRLKTMLPLLAVIAVIAYFARSILGTMFFENKNVWHTSIIFAGLCALFWFNVKTKEGLSAFLAAILIMVEIMVVKETVLERSRNFFGVLSIYDGGTHYLMRHGTTLHGAIAKDDVTSPETQVPKALTYYAPVGAMALSITNRQASLKAAGQVGTYGVVGLGAGSLACYSQPGETWRYFEIDQAVIDAANNSKYFSFMNRCAKNAPVILGDARITLRQEAKASYDVLVIDAFSSDSIPVHLITTDAINEYLSLVKPDGVLTFHISNRHLDLAPILAANMTLLQKTHPGLHAVQYINWPGENKNYVTASNVVMFSRDEAALRAMKTSTSAKSLEDKGKATAWTDDYSNILAAMFFSFKE